MVRSIVKIPNYKKAKDIKPGEAVLDRGRNFIVKEVGLIAEYGWIRFLDTEDVWHGVYHPDEFLGVGESSWVRKLTM
jgi:hypothetical protein